MTTVGLVLILMATLAVVQTQSVTVSPVQADLSSLFETAPKTGQLTLQAPPYCGPFDIFCFVIALIRAIFARVLPQLAGIFGGFGSFSTAPPPPAAPLSTSSSSSTATVSDATVSSASSCPDGREGRQCRRDARAAERAARRANR